jgi:hypothetical protein
MYNSGSAEHHSAFKMPFWLSSRQENEVVGIDLGSTTLKLTRGIIHGALFSIINEDYTPYDQGELELDKFGPVRSWWDGNLTENLSRALTYVGGKYGAVGFDNTNSLPSRFTRSVMKPLRHTYAALGVTGLSNSGLSIVNLKSGMPVASFYDKRPLTYLKTENASEILQRAGVDPKADISYTFSKALAYAQESALILDALGHGKLQFRETGIEPMVCTLLRILTDTPFAQGPGFYGHETKGITGSPNGVKSQDSRRVLTTFGYAPNQYTATDRNAFPESDYYLAGDFQLLQENVKAYQDSGELDSRAIGIETGSNIKVYVRSDNKLDATSRFSPIGFSYNLLKNGAAVHSRIFMKYLLTDRTNEKEWFVRANNLAAAGKEHMLLGGDTKYMYFPKVKDEDSIGILINRETGEEAEWNDVAKMTDGEKAIIAATVYFGVAAELRKMLEELSVETGISDVYLHDQFVSEDNQPFKRDVLASMFGKKFNSYLVGIPNASEMAALSAARMKFGPEVKSDRKIAKTLLKGTMDMEEYYSTWRELRDYVNPPKKIEASLEKISVV